jgi:predicted pyridoxine 5'-phosphate oxidase superfamily flavin-nucleotide-binding protein
MGKVHDVITEPLRAFIEAQRLFFVATAPSGPDGHVNASPKGLDSLRVVDERTVAYLDFVGSGVETIAHLRDNGRIVLMFCAFEGPPKIVRLHGRGEALEPGTPDFEALRPGFPAAVDGSVRSIIRVRVARVSDSCGYAVPLYRFEGDRRQLDDWATKKGPEKLAEYQEKNNAASIDGLPGLKWVRG